MGLSHYRNRHNMAGAFANITQYYLVPEHSPGRLVDSETMPRESQFHRDKTVLSSWVLATLRFGGNGSRHRCIRRKT